MYVHCSVLFVPILAEVFSRSTTVIALVIISVIYTGCEFLRLRGRVVPVITRFTLRMNPSLEEGHFISQPIYLAAGVALALLLFPKEVAYASIIIVAVGDPVAGYVGARFAQLRCGVKSLEGFVAGLVAATLVASLVVLPPVSLIGATGGMTIELWDGLEDNLTIPLAAGGLMVLAQLFMPTR